MITPIRRIHHVTATVTDAQADVDFYTGLLGLRLVKRTVNFDNTGVYHFYYGDERGSPSTLMTTFPYRGWGVPAGIRGAGQIHVTAFSIPSGALGFWEDRLRGAGAEPLERGDRFGAPAVILSDPSGLRIELVEGPEDGRAPWVGAEVPSDAAVRGIHSVRILLHEVEPSADLLQEHLGFRVLDQAGPVTRMAPDGVEDPGSLVDLVSAPAAPAARNGLGTVHHVAFEVADPAAQLAFRERLLEAGLDVTGVRDRQYFRSIYFREPGGVLYELATSGPGMTVDEPLELLGGELTLPPWEEPNRRSIEAQLDRITTG